MIVLVVMKTGCIVSNGERAVHVTVQRIVSGGSSYILVDRVFDAITDLSATNTKQYRWLTPSVKVALIVISTFFSVTTSS